MNKPTAFAAVLVLVMSSLTIRAREKWPEQTAESNWRTI